MSDRRWTVAELKAAEGLTGQPFQAVLLIRKISQRTARNSNPFLQIELGDKTGSFSLTCFNDLPFYETLRTIAEGSVVSITANFDSYNGRFSPKLLKAVALSDEEIAASGCLDHLVEGPPDDPDALRAELRQHIDFIGHGGLRATVEAVLEDLGDSFYLVPAAVSMHHAYRSGLLEHTVRMARACRALLPLYPEVHADLAMAGVLAHDAGKAIEYAGELSCRKTRPGRLQGHVVLGYRLVRRAGMKAKLSADLLERLEHIVLSHQGELEWGAAVKAATPEAVFVSMVDNLDAKMGMVQRLIRNALPTDEFTEYHAGLGSELLVAPVERLEEQQAEDEEPRA
jgi:3'-5' exoribonuclease